MESFSNLVRIHVPNYLAGLPLPKSIGGWFKLNFRECLQLVPFLTIVGGSVYLTHKSCKNYFNRKPPVNPEIKKDAQKVVDSFTAEEFKAKTAFCRCWRSANFPYCDGSHNAYNKECCDNVGPLVISAKAEEN
ncbi:CDGSH iron-sulfur domain-containing protein 2 homolog [Artemia franciscana]|uniref:CDGSH iron-sulfur domain-containing protein 2 homologue n=1 Tax=Artemia franciscana TaxID=6661 RepID=A0AA88ILJ5_ARTSF|nr:hypothetical protein QYM36_000471 [Artemia franciscana]